MRQTPIKPLHVVHRPEFGDQTRLFQDNVETYMHLAEHAPDKATFEHYKQLESAWMALAETHDWLEGKIPPLG